MTRPASRTLITSIALTLAACSGKSDYTMTTGGADTPAKKGEVRKLDFENAAAGQLPPELIHVLGDWSVVQAGGTKLLKQTGDYHTDDFPRVVMKDVTFTNVHVKVRCNMSDGSTDQACGLMWRFKDSDNYYIARANALEGNVRLYKVINGDRQQFDSKTTPVAGDEWHTLEAFMEGAHIKIVWNGETIMEKDDTQLATGKVGLWTKADSITSFDDFEATEIEALPK